MFSWLFGSGQKTQKRPTGQSTKSIVRTNIEKRFDLLGRLGQGSMSKVYRARDRKLGITVCLKVLDKEKTARFEARFVGLTRPNEGMICQSLKHRNIVQTFEWGITTKGEQFLVMELIEGLGLNFLIETKHPQLDGNRVNFLAQAAEGLAHVHQHGYMHRDICPRNMMVTSKGLLKLIDLGLAIPDRPEFRRPGNRTGTANYMAPELIKRSSTDPRVDLFALGVTAYEVFTAQLPWPGAQSLQTMLSHLNNPPVHPLELNPDLDDYMVAFLMKAIEREPRDRFQSADQFREVLLGLPKKDY